MKITSRTEDSRMDENSSSLGHQNGGGGGMSGVVVSSQMGGNNSTAMNNKGQQDDQTNQSSGPPHHYSIPGILHFIQHEWARFEHERSQWDVDRAELQNSVEEKRVDLALS
ncbi:Striatin domain-containing protein [Sergentomyia squamirostris]